MQRTTIQGVNYLIVYHTQEGRPKKLSEPLICKRTDAWLGVGYYFWIDEESAHNWGSSSKRATGKYDIYIAELTEENILNATFNETEYYFFVKQIELARKNLAKKLETITLAKVHRFLADKIWPSLGIKGIIFDDIPHNPTRGNIVYSDIKPLYYKKRIQLVIFDKQNIRTFAKYLLNQQCA